MNYRQGSTAFGPSSRRELVDEGLDASKIRGNVSEDVKRHCLKIFVFCVSTPGSSYGADVGERLKLVETNVSSGRESTTVAETVFEVTVRKGIDGLFRMVVDNN